MIKIISASQFAKKKRAGIPKEVFQRTESIVDAVAEKSFAAVQEFAGRFDKFELTEQNVKVVVPAEIRDLNQNQKQAIDTAFVSVKKVQDAIARQALAEGKCNLNDGYVLFKPRSIERVGIYVPGGVAPLPSSLLMAGVTARAAGVKELVVCTPPQKNGISPAIFYVAKKLGVKEVYQLGGAQAIASMAYGLPGIMEKVDMICGPGNVYAAAAKQIVASKGLVKIDMIAGPSEVLIIADKLARADYVAADMLAQAEHGVNSSAILLTDSEKLAQDVQKELQEQISRLKTQDTARQSLFDYGAIVLLENLQQAVEISNRYAPEHLEILVQNPKSVTQNITSAGALFVNTCEAFADYGMSGGNHILPTGGTARFLSGLSVYDFIVRTYIEVMSDEGQAELAEATATFAGIEGLEAHAKAAKLRGVKK